MVLAGLGHSLSEADIRHRCGHTAVGTTLNQISNGLRDIPVVVEYQIDWGLEDLTDVVRSGGWPIVAIDLRPVEGVFAFHAVVVVEITRDQMLVHDPLHVAGPRPIGQATFEIAGSVIFLRCCCHRNLPRLESVHVIISTWLSQKTQSNLPKICSMSSCLKLTLLTYPPQATEKRRRK